MRLDFLLWLVISGLGSQACNPAGDLLEKARDGQFSLSADETVRAYRELIDAFPDAPESVVGAEEAATFALRSAHAELAVNPIRGLQLAKAAYTEWPRPPSVAGEREFLEGTRAELGNLTRQLKFDFASEVIERMRTPAFPHSFRVATQEFLDDEGPQVGRLKAMIRWRASREMTAVDRAQVALSLIEENEGFQIDIQLWLDANLFTAAAELCLTPARNLPSVDDIETLATLETVCGKLRRFAPGAKETAEVENVMSVGIPARRKAIRASPAYRIEEALRVCIEFQDWNKSVHRNPPRTEAALERVHIEFERRKPAFGRAIEYLSGRVQATQDERLAQRFSAACRGR